MKLLIVDDNKPLAGRIREKLSASYSIDHVSSGEEGVERALSGDYGVIVLDLGLPGIGGDETCRRIRTAKSRVPILILTADTRNRTLVTLLDSGADDYLTKPFHTAELRARVAALARRQPLAVDTRVLTAGDLVIDSERHEVSRAGIPLELRRKEFSILEYLVANKGRIVTRQMILDNAWTSETRSWRTTVDVHIKRLRDKVDRPFGAPLIHTAHGLGYKVEDPK